MSVRNTEILNRSDLRYLLIDSLRLYSDNVEFIDGNNPYKFSINKKIYYVLIKNIHESGEGRGNQDECRIQVSKSRNFDEALSSNKTVLVLGYFADERVFTAWNPYLMKDRFNERQTISLYSRFSIQKEASEEKISSYSDTNNQSIVSFKPEYLGLYLENIAQVHLLDNTELIQLVKTSDELNIQNIDGSFDSSKGELTITHSRNKRDPNFRKKVYDAYDNKCAMCGMQLELIEAAHIIPHSHEKGTDEVDNGVALCSLHHTAYDRSLIYFDNEFNILMNETKVEYLEKIGLDSGLRKFEKLSFDTLIIPENQSMRPYANNISIANKIRGIIY